MYADSFVEFLGSNHLFEQMFENDLDIKLLFKIGEEATANYDEFEQAFVTNCLQVFALGQDQYQLRKKEVEQFTKNVENAKTKSQNESIEQMEIFGAKKKVIFDKIKKLQDDVDNRDISLNDYDMKVSEFSDEFNVLVHQTWKKLMGLEIVVYEQLEEVNQTFEQTLTEMVNNFIENAQGMFALMRTAEQTYTENINDCAMRYMTTASLTADFHIPKDLKPLMSDKDVLMNSLAASHDMHLQAIDNREDRLVSRAKAWLAGLVSNLAKDEISRNRTKVLEINYYLDMQREEFDDLANIAVGPALDPDISAALD